jgi:signal transduction histidine kinase
MAVFGGYLLLRDVNRDVHMTEVRSQFVASVSHELKTPLTAIRMFAEAYTAIRIRRENWDCTAWPHRAASRGA